MSEYQRHWARTHPESRKESTRKYRAKFPEKHREAQRRYSRNNPDYHYSRRLLKDYGITLAAYHTMVASQSGTCAICGKTPVGRLCVDHDHETGKIRGLLCRQCNAAIGLLGDTQAALQRATLYFVKNVVE